MKAGYTAFQAGALRKCAQMGVPFQQAQTLARNIATAPTDGDADNGGNVPTDISPDDVAGKGPSSGQVMHAQQVQGLPPQAPVPSSQLAARNAILSVLGGRQVPAMTTPRPAAPVV